MEERYVTTGDGPSEAAQRLMDGIGVFSEIEDYGRRIEVLAEAMSVGIRIADYELLAACGALLAACGALLAATRNRSEWTGAWL